MESQASVAARTRKQQLAASTGRDTSFRCMLARLVVHLGMRIVLGGARILSANHPARLSYISAASTWHERTRKMPFRGFTPTDDRVISGTQLLWLLIALAAIVYVVIGEPHFPFDLL